MSTMEASQEKLFCFAVLWPAAMNVLKGRHGIRGCKTISYRI